MNLAQVIHQRWAAASALNDLLPASRVHTGISTGGPLPFAVLSKENDRPVERFGDGSAIDTVGVRIQVFCEDADAGAAVMHQIKTAFDCTSFDLAASDKVIDMKRTNDFARPLDDGTWQFVVDFDCTVQLATGV